MRDKLIFSLLILASMGLLTLCCDGHNTHPSAAELTAKGWDEFQIGDYAEAISKFDSATNANSHYFEAYCGLGWCYAMLSDDSVSVENFEVCLDLIHDGTIAQDAKAGLAFAYEAHGQYADAISAAVEVLTVDPKWSFSHNGDFSSSDLHLLLAECYFAQSDFDSSLAQVVILDPNFSADVDTRIGRGALADEIERLRGSV